MQNHNIKTAIALIAFVCLGLGLSGTQTANSAAIIKVVNLDGVGEGFNDPTPFTPVGGNPAVTLGDARLLAFQHAAFLWGRWSQ